MTDARTLTLVSRKWTVDASAEYGAAGMPDIVRPGLPTIRPARLKIEWKNNELSIVSVTGCELTPNGQLTRRPATEWWTPVEVTGGPTPVTPDWVRDAVRNAKMPTSIEDVITNG